MAANKKSGLGDETLKAAASSPLQAIKGAAISTVKSSLQKINPLDKKINQADTSETGVESLRLGYTTGKQAKNAVKTTAQTIKTTQRTIKTTGRTAKETGKTAIRVVKTTVKVTVNTVKAAGSAATHIAAAMTNPVVLIVTLVILMLLLMVGYVIVMLGGAAGAASSIRNAYENAEGLEDVAASYTEGTGFYQIAMANAQSAFYTKIDSLYYDAADLSHSNLVYFTKNFPGSAPQVLYRDYSVLANDAEKAKMKSTWQPYFSEKEVLAITYVYLQKQENDARGTDGALYMVEYTQEALDTVVSALYALTDTVYHQQECHSKDCSVHQVENPQWKYCSEKLGEAARIINGEVPGNVEQARIDYENWAAAMAAYPQYIDENYCPKEHDTHSVALTFYDKASVLMQLGISEDKYATWVEMTLAAFENNENIP